MYSNMVFDDWQSILFYLLVFGLATALIYYGNKREGRARHLRVICTSLGLAIPILLAGLRHGVGRDYAAYSGMIENLQAGREMYYRAIEPLSTLIIQASASLGGSVMMFSLFSAITVLFAYVGIKRMLPTGAKYIALGFFMYLCIAFPITLNAVRSGAAIALAVFAFSYLVDARARHRLPKFVGWIGVASLLHVSAVICLPIGVIAYLTNRGGKLRVRAERILLGASVLAALAFPLFGGVIAHVPVQLISNYDRFLTQLGDHFDIPIATMVMLLMLVFALVLTRDRARKDERLRMLRSVAVYYIPLAVIVGWLSYYPSMSRIVFFLEPILFVLLTYVVWETRGTLPRLYPIQALVAAVVLAFSVVMLARNLTWAHALPYNTVFSKEYSDARKN